MSLIKDVGIGFFAAILLYFWVPIAVGLVSQSRGHKLAQLYVKQATSALGVGGLVIRGQRLALRGFRQDQKVNGRWKTKLGGKKRHFGDPANALSKAYGSPFGLFDEAKGVVTTPLAMETGELLREPIAGDDMQYQDREGNYWIRGYVSLPESPRLVDYTGAAPAIDGSSDASSVQRVWDLIVVALAERNDENNLQYVRWAAAFVFGLGIVLMSQYMSNSLLGESAGGGVDVPLGAIAPVTDLVVMLA